MQRIPRWLSVGALVGACVIAAGCPGGCSKNPTSPTSNTAPTAAQSVTVTPASVQLTVGQTQQFNASVLPSGVSPAVTWTVSPTSIATISSSGLVTAVAAGQATVTAASVATPATSGTATIAVSAPVTPPTNPPYIHAMVLSVLNGPNYLADPQSVDVCTDSTCATPINNANVTINGTPLTYNSQKLKYTGSLTISPGSTFSLKVSLGGFDYLASATQSTQFPILTAPASGGSWDAGVPNTMTWSAGAPTTGAVYYVGIVTGSGKMLYPTDKPLELPSTTLSYTIPANWTSIPGDYYPYVGIGNPGVGNSGATGQAIPNAAPKSGLVYGGIYTLTLVHTF